LPTANEPTPEDEQQTADDSEVASEMNESNGSEASQNDDEFPIGFAIGGGVLLLVGIGYGTWFIIRRTAMS
jgi:hypothetical protein